MNFLQVHFENQETILDSFNRIADKISKDINLNINNAHYRLVDFEFYTYSAALPDPHTYKNKLQLQNSKLYLHSSGVDVTFGDGINHGGILLRSIVKLYDGTGPDHGFMKEQFEGPQIVASELFSNLHPLDSSEKNVITITDIEGRNQDSCFFPARIVLKTKRVGLTPKSSDLDAFYQNLALRYITVLPKFPRFKQNIKGIESLLREQLINGKITENEARDIVGYKMSFA